MTAWHIGCSKRWSRAKCVGPAPSALLIGQDSKSAQHDAAVSLRHAPGLCQGRRRQKHARFLTCGSSRRPRAPGGTAATRARCSPGRAPAGARSPATRPAARPPAPRPRRGPRAGTRARRPRRTCPPRPARRPRRAPPRAPSPHGATLTGNCTARGHLTAQQLARWPAEAGGARARGELSNEVPAAPYLYLCTSRAARGAPGRGAGAWFFARGGVRGSIDARAVTSSALRAADTHEPLCPTSALFCCARQPPFGRPCACPRVRVGISAGGEARAWGR